MGRSKWLPAFLVFAGERFIVILFAGNLKPEFTITALIRSLASRTVISGSPTIVSAGNPLFKSVSTVIKFDSIPYKAVSYTHLRAHETRHDLVCRLLLEK